MGHCLMTLKAPCNSEGSFKKDRATFRCQHPSGYRESPTRDVLNRGDGEKAQCPQQP